LRGEEPQPSWDLWALVVVAYEMLAGARPFGTAPGEWQSAVLAGRFTPLAAHLPEAAPDWQAFFERAFAPEPRQRPASARSLLSDLERTFA
jgi:serine/threonine protein kinase